MAEKNFSELDLLQTFPFRNAEPVLVDVGAHHGSFLLPFAKKGWRVIAFEPEASNWLALLQNTKNYSNVYCNNKAISNENAEHVQFYVSEEHFGIHSLKPFHETHRPGSEVSTIRLDDALAHVEISEVTLLKIDIEGADFLALKGFDLQSFRPEVVMLEFMDSRSTKNFGYNHHAVVAYMQQRGFCAFVSEWAQISQYGREGQTDGGHTWLSCRPYPLDHEPSWGNLIFVQQELCEVFSATLEAYLEALQRHRPSISLRGTLVFRSLRKIARYVPGARAIYRKIKYGRR